MFTTHYDKIYKPLNGRQRRLFMMFSLILSQLIYVSCSGNLMTRSLVDLVKKEDFVHESDYLQTLLVVVPKSVCDTVVHVHWRA